ncbi:MAG: helix-turn-helix domain-containing protein [Candidatus Erginobacter occultus]|nr:helix-turn-helix domain-containing protein [Candidatus Erginobacter occultus]
MEINKQKRLKARGWRVGSAEDFLGLSREEIEYIELKLLLGEHLTSRRRAKKLKQVELAELLQSSQSRVAKMEKGDSTVSLDLLIRALLALGATRRDLAGILSSVRTVARRPG